MKGRVWGRRIGLTAIVWLAGLSAACDEKLRDLAGPSPNLKPTFASIQHEIFETTDGAGRPACINCHTNQGRNPTGGLNLAVNPYDAIVNVPSRRRPDMMLVAPGNPENSYIIHKLEGRSDIVGARMPFNGPYLTNGQILVIRRWIEIGAPRN